MKLKKTILITGAAGTVGIACMLGTGLVSAATSTTAGTSLVDKIAAKFNLSKDDVQKVFDEDRTAHEAEMQATVEKELSQAVSDGKITEEQKTAILAKRKEIQTQRDADKDSFSSLSDDERKARMDAERTALDTWVSDNGISTDYLRYVFGGHGGHGMRRGPAGRM